MKLQRSLPPNKPSKPLRRSLRRKVRKYVVAVPLGAEKHEVVIIEGKRFLVSADKNHREAIELETARTSTGEIVSIFDAYTKQEIAVNPADAASYKPRPVLGYQTGTFRPNVLIWATPSPDWMSPLGPDEPGHEVIEELFREARTGKFDAFSERIKGFFKRSTARYVFKRKDPSRASTEQQALDPLSAARQRGTQYALNEWQKPENLSLQTAAAYAGVSDNTINTRRQRQQLYALVAPNKSRGFRYPQWQFDVDADRLSAAVTTFVVAGQKNSWVLHSFMTRPSPELDGMRPCDYIADRSKDLKRLVQIMQRRFSSGDQGAV